MKERISYVDLAGENQRTDLCLRDGWLHTRDLAVGSILVVCPATDIPIKAKLAIINKDSTPLDSVADYVINDSSGSVLLLIVQQLYEISAS